MFMFMVARGYFDIAVKTLIKVIIKQAIYVVKIKE